MRATTRLVDSPACIVVDEGDMSAHLARLLKQAGQERAEVASRSWRSTPSMRWSSAWTAERSDFDDLAQILFDQALLAEGGQLEDPAGYVRRVNRLLALIWAARRPPRALRGGAACRQRDRRALPFMVNYRVADVHALVAALRAEGCDVLEKIEESEYG
ncbi:MAG: hypothetical protein MZW92_64975 [Comamonadaceae bacterium]|nr:hypothetical protein [Comamonadaceae bacterium]